MGFLYGALSSIPLNKLKALYILHQQLLNSSTEHMTLINTTMLHIDDNVQWLSMCNARFSLASQLTGAHTNLAQGLKSTETKRSAELNPTISCVRVHCLNRSFKCPPK